MPYRQPSFTDVPLGKDSGIRSAVVPYDQPYMNTNPAQCGCQPLSEFLSVCILTL